MIESQAANLTKKFPYFHLIGTVLLIREILHFLLFKLIRIIKSVISELWNAKYFNSYMMLFFYNLLFSLKYRFLGVESTHIFGWYSLNPFLKFQCYYSATIKILVPPTHNQLCRIHLLTTRIFTNYSFCFLSVLVIVHIWVKPSSNVLSYVP